MIYDCAHASKIIIHDFSDGITLELCTWACGCLIWCKTDGLTTREITADEAAKLFSVLEWLDV